MDNLYLFLREKILLISLFQTHILTISRIEICVVVVRYVPRRVDLVEAILRATAKNSGQCAVAARSHLVIERTSVATILEQRVVELTPELSLTNATEATLFIEHTRLGVSGIEVVIIVTALGGVVILASVVAHMKCT